MVNKAVFLTAFDRDNYLLETLASWADVRGVQDWRFVFRIEPGPMQTRMADFCFDWIELVEHPNADIILNERQLGVLHHPWVGFETMFNEQEMDFVIRAEDDLVVSDDILDYFTWAEHSYRNHPEVATIHGYTDGSGDDPAGVVTLPQFNPWVWGTWADVWAETIGPTWDHDYSTFNEYPLNESGWDWNLDTRIFPKEKLVGVYPEMSRVGNIGVNGVHSHSGNWRTAPTFRPSYGAPTYRET